MMFQTAPACGGTSTATLRTALARLMEVGEEDVVAVAGIGTGHNGLPTAIEAETSGEVAHRFDLGDVLRAIAEVCKMCAPPPSSPSSDGTDEVSGSSSSSSSSSDNSLIGRELAAECGPDRTPLVIGLALTISALLLVLALVILAWISPDVRSYFASVATFFADHGRAMARAVGVSASAASSALSAAAAERRDQERRGQDEEGQGNEEGQVEDDDDDGNNSNGPPIIRVVP